MSKELEISIYSSLTATTQSTVVALITSIMSPHINAGGYLLFHDYQPARKDFGPTWVIENLVIPSKRFMPIEIAGSVWAGVKSE